jgi:putative RNA 2'-phosphotransferase
MSEWTPELTRASKFLSLVLRHRPEAAGITLDANGWADIDALVAGGHGLTRELLERVVATNPKQRFAIDETGTLIRAVQGHSVDVDLAYATATPPATLFHGTHAKVVDAILAGGLKPMRRTHVHLSGDPETARAVGARRGRPVVLAVDAATMHAEGAPFWRATNGVWLCTAVPPARLTVIQ